MVAFPHAGSHKASDALFLAAWRICFQRFGPKELRWRTAALPRLNHKVTLSEQIRAGNQFSLDVLCRLMVPSSYRDTMQATKPFLAVNSHILEPVKTKNHRTGRTVNGATLKNCDLNDSDLSVQAPAAEALFQSYFRAGELSARNAI